MCNKCGAKCKLNIPVDILNKLPVGGKFIRFDKFKQTYDEKDNWVIAIVWEWNEIKPRPVTKRAFFNKDTGEYLGED